MAEVAVEVRSEGAAEGHFLRTKSHSSIEYWNKWVWSLSEAEPILRTKYR